MVARPALGSYGPVRQKKTFLYVLSINTSRPMCEFTISSCPCRAFLPMLARGFVVEGMVGSYRIPPIVGTKVNRAVPPVTARLLCLRWVGCERAITDQPVSR